MKRYFSSIREATKDLPDIMTVRQLADKLALSIQTVYMWTYQGLPVLPLGGAVRIAKNDFVEWCELKKGD